MDRFNQCVEKLAQLDWQLITKTAIGFAVSALAIYAFNLSCRFIKYMTTPTPPPKPEPLTERGRKILGLMCYPDHWEYDSNYSRLKHKEKDLSVYFGSYGNIKVHLGTTNDANHLLSKSDRIAITDRAGALQVHLVSQAQAAIDEKLIKAIDAL